MAPEQEMPRSILIVGGGSAGWITANVLNALLGKEHGVEIALVESPNIPIVGVGEATVPSIRRTLQTIGTPERDFMRATDATFKSLIRFVDWNIGQVFDHPFDRRVRPESDAAVDAWLEAGLPQNTFAKAVSLLSNLADANHAPKAVGWPDYASTFPYAYHLDAVKLASFLSRWGVANGIRHSLANVTNVAIDEAGFIDCVQTDVGEALTADLYVDCTGFRARLIGEALNVRARGFSDKILCDRAVTMRVPYEVCAPPRIRPYTLSTRAGRVGFGTSICVTDAAWVTCIPAATLAMKMPKEN
ncbi:MAG: tryptophan 7-halogenase [Rhodospirillales bacterium]|nr:tryptophan 7-halogenase [Rhodospirillales bacterium]